MQRLCYSLVLFLAFVAILEAKPKIVPPPAPKDEEGQKKYDAKIQRKLDLLPADAQQQISIVKKAIQKEGLDKLSPENLGVVVNNVEFFWNASLQANLAKRAGEFKPFGMTVDGAFKDLGLEKRKDLEYLKAKFFLLFDGTERLGALNTAKRIKEVGLGKLQDDEKEFVKKNDWFFNPPDE